MMKKELLLALALMLGMSQVSATHTMGEAMKEEAPAGPPVSRSQELLNQQGSSNVLQLARAQKELIEGTDKLLIKTLLGSHHKLQRRGNILNELGVSMKVTLLAPLYEESFFEENCKTICNRDQDLAKVDLFRN